MKKKGKILTALASVALVLGGGFALAGCDANKENSAEKQMRVVYADAQTNGYTGTYEEWLASIKGEKGDTGMSAYELAKYYGFQGTEQDWLISLRQVEQKKAMDIFKLAEAKLMQSRSNLKMLTELYDAYDSTVETKQSLQCCEYETGKYASLREVEYLNVVSANGYYADSYIKTGSKESEILYNENIDKKSILKRYGYEPGENNIDKYYFKKEESLPLSVFEGSILNIENMYNLAEKEIIVTLDALANGNYKISFIFNSTERFTQYDECELTNLIEAEITRDYNFVYLKITSGGGDFYRCFKTTFEYGTVDKELIKAKIAEAEEYASKQV